MKLNEFMMTLPPANPVTHTEKSKSSVIKADFGSNFRQADVIPEGRRNSTLSHFAGLVIKRYGDTHEAYEIFLAEAAKCSPPVEDNELNGIWKSALGFGHKVEKQEGYYCIIGLVG